MGGGRPSAPGPRPNMGSAPNVGSRPAAGNRPNVGQGNIGARPSTGAPGSRPDIGSVNRPSPGTGNLRPGTGNRPEIGSGPGVANRPAIGSGPGIANRPATGNRPGLGNGPGLDNRPGVANRPSNTLPGMGNRFPNAGDRVPNRGGNLQDRRDNLQGRLEGRGDRQENRQDFRNENREDWQNWANNNHGDWYHGGGGWWDHMWSEHPGWMAFGMTTWGINRLAYGFGLGAYSNPYYSDGGAGSGGYDYSQPIIQPTDYADSTQPGAASVPPAAAMSTFDQARTDFYNGSYDSSLNNINQALKEMPKDAVVHEFRALVLFALGRYSEATTTIHPVLAVGPGWDWATLAGLYPSVDVYTQQLRRLEEYTKVHPKAADACFLLAYHYLTCNYKDAAHAKFLKVVELQPTDTIAADYARMTQPSTPIKADTPVPQPPPVTSIPPDKLLTEKDLIGKWKANGGNGTAFVLELTEKGEFYWSFTQGKTSQKIKGAYALDKNTLAMEPDSGGTMLADLIKQGAGFHFAMQGAPANDPGLVFAR